MPALSHPQWSIEDDAEEEAPLTQDEIGEAYRIADPDKTMTREEVEELLSQ